MLNRFALTLTAAVLIASPTLAQQADEPVVTANRTTETAAALKAREAMAYAYELPRGAPSEDYPLVAWCNALVRGHVALGESLKTNDELDLDIIRLGKLEAADFTSALAESASRQSAGVRAAAQQAAASATNQWAPLLAQADVEARSQSFGLFFGLPGRCEHAARRIRNNITTPPATLKDAGLAAEAATKATPAA